ncbi:hypothetical protein OTU49_011012 [Cherax quadricarinatus]|uniref:Uncharacterized protein n=1 Tax=Cherax quadricarinatus TaxID=27406 RepID=A0AAW0W695_CHEQU
MDIKNVCIIQSIMMNSGKELQLYQDTIKCRILEVAINSTDITELNKEMHTLPDPITYTVTSLYYGNILYGCKFVCLPPLADWHLNIHIETSLHDLACNLTFAFFCALGCSFTTKQRESVCVCTYNCIYK